jgi:hypothetical protein
LHDLILGAKRRRPTLGLGAHGAKGVAPGDAIIRWRRESGGVWRYAMPLAAKAAKDR